MTISLRKRKQSMNSDLDSIAPKQADERRKALKAIGKFALYTPPMLLAQLKSGRASVSFMGSPP
jgi:hypothetical protein